MSADLLTLIFTDLVDSTAVKPKLIGDDIGARNRVFFEDILTPHRQRVEAMLADFGGRVVKTEGDAYFLVFTDVARAAGWAVAVQVSHHSDPIVTPLGPLLVKMGMHVGRPLAVGDDFIGQEVDYAARVAALAQGGQIVVSEAAAALLRAADIRGIAVHAHGVRELKGIGPVPVFELLYAGRQAQPLKEGALSPSNLPPAPAGFVGREELLAELREHLRNGDITILKGEGGIGKTALALTAAHTAHGASELPGGVAWLNCELKPGRDECLRQMAHVFLGDRMERELIDRCETRVMRHLREHRALVIFDNFESVTSDMDLRLWLAQVQAPARALVTTREVPPGLHGRVVEVAELPRAEATALFATRAAATGLRAADVAHRGTPARGGELPGVVDDLCAAVGDLPLAIELLAARAARLPLPRLLESVRRDLGVLDAKGDYTRPDRHRSARACFALSYDQLSSDARALLLRLSVLPDGASGEVITAVLERDDWDEAAEELVAASVWRLAGGRYTVHPLVRQFALATLGSERADAERQAARAMARLVLAKGELTKPGAAAPALRVEALDWIAAEWRNLLACAGVAFLGEDWPTVGDLSYAVREFFLVRGYWEECEQLYERALAARRRMGDRAGEGQALISLGNARYLQGHWKAAETSYQASLAIQREIGDRVGEATTLSNLGVVYTEHRRWADAGRCYRESLVIRRELGDRAGEGQTLNNLGNVYRRQKRWKAAMLACQRSLAIGRELGDRIGEGKALRNLGLVHEAQQQWASAEGCYQRSLAMYREVGDRVDEGEVLCSLGDVCREQGRRAEADGHYRESLALSRALGDRLGEGGTLSRLAELRAAQGNFADALEVGREAVAVLEATEDTQMLAAAREAVARWEQRSS
jgi:class 3 adenylate cyclase/tetratricopeptide (TPR) repeat protein